MTVSFFSFPFKIKDVEFSGILYVANKVLSHIADLIEENPGEILEWMSRTEQNFHKFFSFPSDSGSANSDNLFYDYDLVIKDRIFKRTASSFAILSSELVSDQEAKALIKWMSNDEFCAEYDTIASTDQKESYFKPVTYWRGPIWINTNWALWLGLLRHGYTERAERIHKEYLNWYRIKDLESTLILLQGWALGGRISRGQRLW
jgi:glycogen debranching enzyme